MVTNKYISKIITDIHHQHKKNKIMQKKLKKIGKQIEKHRKKNGVSTYDLQKAGIHSNLKSTIEKGEKGYSINSLLKYLYAIDSDLIIKIVKDNE